MATKGKCIICGAISIHAPVKGATCDVYSFIVNQLISIHAPVKGATSRSKTRSMRLCDFNPRTREGCDIDDAAEPQPAPAFQSTHP